MVNVNPKFNGIQQKNLKVDATKKLVDTEKLEKTSGNNKSAAPKPVVTVDPVYAIHNLHYNQLNELECEIDSEEDFAALQIIANESNKNVNFKIKGSNKKGRVTPD